MTELNECARNRRDRLNGTLLEPALCCKRNERFSYMLQWKCCSFDNHINILLSRSCLSCWSRKLTLTKFILRFNYFRHESECSFDSVSILWHNNLQILNSVINPFHKMLSIFVEINAVLSSKSSRWFWIIWIGEIRVEIEYFVSCFRKENQLLDMLLFTWAT